MATTTTLINDLRKGLPFSHKAMAKVFDIREDIRGASNAVFAQDTATVWLPKVMVARSMAERFEVSFLEFVESAFFYYMVPLSAQYAFQPMFRKLGGNISIEQLMKPVKSLTQLERKAILPVKAACLLSAFGIVTVSGEYALNFVKNLMTEGFFKKSRFADVINLTTPHDRENKINAPTDTPQRTSVTEHALKRITQCLSIGVGLFAVSAWLAMHGRKYPWLIKGLGELLEKLDFNYNTTQKSFGLNHRHFQVMLPIAVLGYIDAARDKLEFIEVAIRASMTAFFLGWGSRMLEGWANRNYGNKIPGLMKKAEDGSSSPKSLELLIKEAITHAQTTVPSGSQAELVAAAKKHLMPRLAAKTKLYLLPVGFGAAVIGVLVALLNQFWTQYRFKTLQKEQNQFLSRFQAANPNRLQYRGPDMGAVKV
jgi:hypothetical protein